MSLTRRPVTQSQATPSFPAARFTFTYPAAPARDRAHRIDSVLRPAVVQYRYD